LVSGIDAFQNRSANLQTFPVLQLTKILIWWSLKNGIT